MSSPQLHNYDLGERVVAFSTTRKGGISEGEYASFNINPYCGDSPSHISENLSRLSRALGLPSSRILLPHQTHSDKILTINNDFYSLSELAQANLLDGVDALITAIGGVCVGVSTADCIPVLLYAPDARVVAAVHAGWRGTCQRICQKTIEQMRQTYAVDTAQLRAVVGPGICEDCFEVGQEVYDKFEEANFDMSLIAVRHNKWHINLPETNRMQLVEAGVPPVNITMAGLCTLTDADKWFSARRQGIQSGRIYTGIILKT